MRVGTTPATLVGGVLGVAAGVRARPLALVVRGAALFVVRCVLVVLFRQSLGELGVVPVAVGRHALLPHDAAGGALEHLVDRPTGLRGECPAQARGERAPGGREALDDLFLPVGEGLVDHAVDGLADVLLAGVESGLVTGVQRCCLTDNDESETCGVLFGTVACVLVVHWLDRTRDTSALPGQMGDLLLQDGHVDDFTDPWLQRLRDGVTPPVWPLVVGSGLATVIGVLLLVAEAAHTEDVHRMSDSRVGFLVALVPLGLVVGGPVLAIGSGLAGRSDRRVVAAIRSGTTPGLFLPVTTSSIRADDDLPQPRPSVWAVDRDGMHGWAVGRDRPVVEVPWRRVQRIDLATRWDRGVRTPYGIWVDTDAGHLVLRPRTALARPTEAGAGRREHLAEELRRRWRESC